jgi:putative endonuclease
MKAVVNMENNEINGIILKSKSEQELGKEGEKLARKMYESKGFRIVMQNFRCKIGEIDLICEKDKLLVFCEVKCRRSITFGIPAEAINTKKIRHIRRVASWFLSQKLCIHRIYSDYDMRFDVVEVLFVNENYELNHIENAF